MEGLRESNNTLSAEIGVLHSSKQEIMDDVMERDKEIEGLSLNVQNLEMEKKSLESLCHENSKDVKVAKAKLMEAVTIAEGSQHYVLENKNKIEELQRQLDASRSENDWQKEVSSEFSQKTITTIQVLERKNAHLESEKKESQSKFSRNLDMLEKNTASTIDNAMMRIKECQDLLDVETHRAVKAEEEVQGLKEQLVDSTTGQDENIKARDQTVLQLSEKLRNAQDQCNEMSSQLVSQQSKEQDRLEEIVELKSTMEKNENSLSRLSEKHDEQIDDITSRHNEIIEEGKEYMEKMKKEYEESVSSLEEEHHEKEEKVREYLAETEKSIKSEMDKQLTIKNKKLAEQQDHIDHISKSMEEKHELTVKVFETKLEEAYAQSEAIRVEKEALVSELEASLSSNQLEQQGVFEERISKMEADYAESKNLLLEQEKEQIEIIQKQSTLAIADAQDKVLILGAQLQAQKKALDTLTSENIIIPELRHLLEKAEKAHAEGNISSNSTISDLRAEKQELERQLEQDTSQIRSESAKEMDALQSSFAEEKRSMEQQHKEQSNKISELTSESSTAASKIVELEAEKKRIEALLQSDTQKMNEEFLQEMKEVKDKFSEEIDAMETEHTNLLTSLEAAYDDAKKQSEARATDAKAKSEVLEKEKKNLENHLKTEVNRIITGRFEFGGVLEEL